METIATPVQMIMYRIYLRSINCQLDDAIENTTRDLYSFARQHKKPLEIPLKYHQYRACILAAMATDTPLPSDIEQTAATCFSFRKCPPADTENRIRRHARELLGKLEKINEQHAEMVHMLKKSTRYNDIHRAHWLDSYFGIFAPEISVAIQHGMIYKLGYIEGIRAERARRRNKR